MYLTAERTKTRVWWTVQCSRASSVLWGPASILSGILLRRLWVVFSFGDRHLLKPFIALQDGNCCNG